MRIFSPSNIKMSHNLKVSVKGICNSQSKLYCFRASCIVFVCFVHGQLHLFWPLLNFLEEKCVKKKLLKFHVNNYHDSYTQNNEIGACEK